MTIRLVDAPDPRKVPSFALWTMYKNGRTREARMRILPVGEGLLEVAVYELRSDQQVDLLWAMTLNSGPDVFQFVGDQQREYERQGWTLDLAALSRDLRMHG